MKKSVALSKVYQFLEPGPVTMVTSFCEGKANVMTMSWHTMIDFVPPILGCVISDQNYSFDLIRRAHECVINIPTVEMIRRMVRVGNVSGKNVDKFKKFKLATEPASLVQAPLLSECFISLECKVIDASMAEKYNLWILEVVKAWKRPMKCRARMIHHQGHGLFVIDGELIKIPSQKK